MTKQEIEIKLNIAKNARALIGDFKNWTRGTNARTIENKACKVEAADAACWCAVGALKRFGDGYFEYYTDLILDLNEKAGEVTKNFPGRWIIANPNADIIFLNDTYWSHEDRVRDDTKNHRLVLQAYDLVIADLEKQIV